eukprot:3435309-Rhodomonas_salina.1
MAMSSSDLDARINALHQKKECGSEEDCADGPSAVEINAAVEAAMKNLRTTQLYGAIILLVLFAHLLLAAAAAAAESHPSHT